jgi:hypothetical protein
MWMPPKHSRAERAELVRTMGLYLGPAFLALMLGRAVYEVACDGWRFALVRSRENVEMSVFFIVIGVLVASVARAPLTRLGWGLFAALHVLIVLGPWVGYVPDRWLLNWLFVTFASLVTFGGVRRATRGALILAACGFIAMLTLSYASRYYTDVLLERQSVLRSSPLC